MNQEGRPHEQSESLRGKKLRLMESAEISAIRQHYSAIIKDLHEEFRAQHSLNSQLTAKWDDLNAENSCLSNEVKTLKDQCHCLEDQLAERNTEISTMRQAHAAVIKDLHARIHQISIDRDSYQSKVQALQHQNNELHQTVQEHTDALPQEELQAQKSLNSLLNSQLEKFSGQINDTQEQNNPQIKEYPSFQHPENIHHQQMEAHSNQISSLRTLILNDTKCFVGGSSEDGTIKIWNATDKRCKATLSSSKHIFSLETFTINGHSYITFGGWDPYDIEIWDIATKTCIKKLKGHSDIICSLSAFQMNDKQYLASGSMDNKIKIWDALTYQCIATLMGHSDDVNGLSVYKMNDNLFLVSASSDKSIKKWDLQKMNEVATLTGHSKWVWSVVTYYNNDKIYVASGSRDKTIKLWDVMTHELVSTFEGHSCGVTSLAVFQSGENTCLASGSVDKTIKLWNLADNTLISTLLDINSCILSVLTFHDDKNDKSYLISGHDNGKIMMWSE